MTVAELIAELQKMPQDLPVEVNNNRRGEILYIDQVDYFSEEDLKDSIDGDYPVVMIQVEVD